MTGSDQTGKFHGYTKQLCWDTFIKSNSVTLDDFIQLGRAYLSQFSIVYKLIFTAKTKC